MYQVIFECYFVEYLGVLELVSKNQSQLFRSVNLDDSKRDNFGNCKNLK